MLVAVLIPLVTTIVLDFLPREQALYLLPAHFKNAREIDVLFIL